MRNMLYHDQIVERTGNVDIEDRGYQFGDGVYEVIGVYEGEPLMLDEHLERLERSANEIRLSLPDSISDLKSHLLELAKRDGLQEGIIYMQITRGIAPREHAFPSSDVKPVTIAYTREEPRDTALEDNGATAVLAEDIRWLRCDIKTLNLLPNALAKQKAVEQNAIEAILHRDHIVTEASASNVFIVKDGELCTHPANHYILNGITRRKIIQQSNEQDIPVHETPFTVDDLFGADEVFISATKSDIVPILKIDDQTIGSGKPGPITKRVKEAFRQLYQKNVRYQA